MIGQLRMGEMVFAKCQNYPYWPGKIIACFPQRTSYKVLFYGEKSQATIDQTYIVPFTDQTYRKFSSQAIAKTNKALKYSLGVALKRYNKRKRGQLSQSQQEDFFQQSQIPRRSQSTQPQLKLIKTKISSVKQPEDPHMELAALLLALSDQASDYQPQNRTFTVQQENRLRFLLGPGAGLLLPTLIDYRVIQRFIVVLKELDLWELKQWPQLNQLHGIIRNRYEEYKSIILSPQFAAMPLRQAKRQLIIQKVQRNKACL